MKKNRDGKLYLLTGILFMIIGMTQDLLMAYVVAACMFIMAIQLKKKNK